MSLLTLLPAALALTLGAVVQGVSGFGLALVAVPLVALVNPALIPVPILLTTSAHAVLTMFRERAHVDWRGVGWAMAGRLPGTVLGVLVVDALPQREFMLVVGTAVLVCVGLSLSTWHPQPTPRALVLAGVASGAFGTAMSVGGPPVALLYQHATGPAIRATLGAYFSAGSVTSVSAFLVAGKVSGQDWAAAGILLPFLLLGFLLSGPLRRFADAGRMRVIVLMIAAASAVVLVVKALL